LQRKAPKEIHAILTETLGKNAPSFATVKKWVAQFKRGDFSACDAPRPGPRKTVTTPKIIDQIHELIATTRRQSSNRWSGGIAAYTAPKNSECKNPLENFSPRFFWDQDDILLIDYLPKGRAINAEYYSSLLVQLKDIWK